MSILIGVDVGTTKTAVVALDSGGGGVVASEAGLNDAALPAEPDASEHDARRLIEQALGLMAQVTARLGSDTRSVAALGVTGQMHGVVLVGAAGEPLTPLVGWQDQRGNRLYAGSSHSYVEEVSRRIGPELQRRAGCAPATGYGAVTLFRMKAEGGLPDEARALTIHDLLVHAMTGVAVTDPTDAASWGIYDVQRGGWLREALDGLALPTRLFPEIQPTASLAGRLSAALAHRLGLPEGLPVAVALGDNQASFLGSVPSLAGSLLLNLGTGGQMCVSTDRFVRLADLETRPLVAGRWLLVGASLCGGRAYQILEGFLRQVGREVFGVDPGPSLYETMNALASATAEDCGGVRVSPLFNGTRADPSLRAAITGLSPDNFTPGHIARAMIAGMVEELLGQFEAAQQAGAQAQLVVGAGNAVRKNPVVSREIARRAGLPLILPPYDEEAAVGAALAAGVAAGVYHDWHAVGRALFRAHSA